MFVFAVGDRLRGLLGNARVFGVVVHDIVGFQGEHAIDQGKGERRDAHGDHDCGQDHALGQGICHRGPVIGMPSDDRRIAGGPAQRQNEQIDRVADQKQTQDHACQVAFQHQIDAARGERADDDE
ncbi:Uncharacterised protein [Mycobacteroides abscessus]|nr:Uncharacterised protein [Mycobacteroides abscessus]